jgi:Sugar-transfer associated ATP-grasp
MLSRLVDGALWRLQKLTGIQPDSVRELRRAGRSAPSIIADWLRVRRGAGRLQLWEYFYYNLDRTELSAQERAAFVGWFGQDVLVEFLVDEYSMILNVDKVTFDYVARGAGLPVPEIFAVYAPRPRPGRFKALTSPQQLRDFLREWRRFPIYCKPACGGSGSKNFQIERWADERAVVTGGTTLSPEELAARLTEPTGLGFLLLETLRPHSEIESVAGDSISGVRLHVLRRPGGPVIFRPLWKPARRGAVVDNFQNGESGNMLAAIDVASGRIERVISGSGRNQLVNQPHPDTGRQLVGFELPYWQALRELAREAELFPGFLCQGWDVAICSTGPVILEVNWFGDVIGPQLAHGRGFLEGEMLTLLQERGLEPLLKGRFKRLRPGRYARSWVCPNGRLGRRKAHWPY